jgi:hypothetical protein
VQALADVIEAGRTVWRRLCDSSFQQMSVSLPEIVICCFMVNAFNADWICWWSSALAISWDKKMGGQTDLPGHSIAGLLCY